MAIKLVGIEQEAFGEFNVDVCVFEFSYEGAKRKLRIIRPDPVEDAAIILAEAHHRFIEDVKAFRKIIFDIQVAD